MRVPLVFLAGAIVFSSAAARWRAHRRRVNNAGKSWIKVSHSNVSAFFDPGAQPLMVVTFDQECPLQQSRPEGAQAAVQRAAERRWKIAYEAAAGRPVLLLAESFPRAGHKQRGTGDRF